ncbi:uncharacterized protein LOC101848798 [Aplysia californica]|uniref:Uncharacterized protein LOC101848798 n=1 Tax=Aplysia californica TaxID=6500 RepID=A0ABM0JDH0_APLCA|nr:uncharacterized protein LOC101848798 [Aplysia californica]
MPKKKVTGRSKQLQKAREMRGKAVELELDRSCEAEVESSSSVPVPPEMLASSSILDIPETPRPVFPPDPLLLIPLRSQEKLSRYVVPAAAEDTSRAIVELSQVEGLFKQLQCPQCGIVGTLSLRQMGQFGLALRLSLFCSECSSVVGKPQYTSSLDTSTPAKRKPFKVNQSATAAALMSGLGPYQFNTLCAHLDLPGLNPKTFNKYATQVYGKSESLADKVFFQAANAVRQAYLSMGCVAEDGVLDIAVSFDGSWLTRGHKSLIGIGCVIDVLTGLVLDSHVLSLHCQTCATTGQWKKTNTPLAYDAWLTEHKASGCNINYGGSSGMMEVEAAVVLWSRSMEKFGLRYTTFVGDGDSKAFNKVTEVKPYGPGVQIVKEECLNHVGKRLGTALRNLVSDCSKKGVTLGGRGHGRLTANTIRKLSIYYSRAIRSQATAAEMRTAILASVHHGYSTDDHPQHMYCPSGNDSWCFYKKSLARHVYPGGHKNRVHTPLNYELLHEHLRPVYERLTADSLLLRCERKATQNANESFHHSVWAKCSKTQFRSKQRVEVAVITAAAEFNFGPGYTTELKDLLGVPSGVNTERLNSARTTKRLYKSQDVQKAAAKRRKVMRAKAIEQARLEAEKEDGVAYGPGMF